MTVRRRQAQTSRDKKRPISEEALLAQKNAARTGLPGVTSLGLGLLALLASAVESALLVYYFRRHAPIPSENTQRFMTTVFFVGIMAASVGAGWGLLGLPLAASRRRCLLGLLLVAAAALLWITVRYRIIGR